MRPQQVRARAHILAHERPDELWDSKDENIRKWFSQLVPRIFSLPCRSDEKTYILVLDGQSPVSWFKARWSHKHTVGKLLNYHTRVSSLSSRADRAALLLMLLAQVLHCPQRVLINSSSTPKARSRRRCCHPATFDPLPPLILLLSADAVFRTLQYLNAKFDAPNLLLLPWLHIVFLFFQNSGNFSKIQ